MLIVKKDEIPASSITPTTTNSIPSAVVTPANIQMPSPAPTTMPFATNTDHLISFEDQLFIEAEHRTQDEWRAILVEHYGSEPTLINLNGVQCEAWMAVESNTLLKMPIYVTALVPDTPEGPSILFVSRTQTYKSLDRGGVESGIIEALSLFKTADEYVGVNGSIATTGTAHTSSDQFLSSLVSQALANNAMVQWTAKNRYITILFYSNYYMIAIGLKTK